MKINWNNVAWGLTFTLLVIVIATEFVWYIKVWLWAVFGPQFLPGGG